MSLTPEAWEHKIWTGDFGLTNYIVSAHLFKLNFLIHVIIYICTTLL